MVLSFPPAYGREMLRWLVFNQQPAQRDFGLHGSGNGGPQIFIERELADWPFCTLREFSQPGQDETASPILLVAPLSGHFAFLLREMVVGLSAERRVAVTDWRNARAVPRSAGDFSFDDNIETILRALELLGSNTHIIALCQGAVPALAAAAILARQRPQRAPRSVTLMGGPVDPLANPTRVVNLLRERPLSWHEANLLSEVPSTHPGAWRRVYPAYLQFSALSAYYYRHALSGGEVFRKSVADDGLDPIRFPFFDLFISLMDLPADYFLENIRKVFIDREIWSDGLTFRDGEVAFEAIDKTALMTIEGELDDIAAPGQTSAAHRLCRNVPPAMRRQLLLKEAGHFSMFYGRLWRERVRPEISAFLSGRDALELSRPAETPFAQPASSHPAYSNT